MKSKTLVAVAALAASALTGCQKKEAPAAAPAQVEAAAKAAAVVVDKARLAMFQPLPEVMDNPSNPLTEDKIHLGRMLYYDARLSKNQDVSCNSCHLLDKYGVDNLPFSPGHRQQLGGRNSPTVYNAAIHIAQFWDGRAGDVEEQAKGPILNPVEMAAPSEAYVEEVVASIPEYVELFKKAFPDDEKPLTYDNIANAIGAFERKLVTPSRWDKYLGGDETALTDAEKKGFNTFYESGCMACHMGPGLGGQMFQKLGLVEPFPDLKDNGRFDATQNEADKYFFKVPSLRNIAKTGPYFHDGSVASLEEAVTLMAKHQSGRNLDATQVGEIVTFLNALTGELPMEYIAQPTLPPSTDKTPKPDPS